MEVKIKPTTVNKDLIEENQPLVYLGENSGINFQTPFLGAELSVNLNSISIQAKSPIDTTYTSTSFVFNEKVLGFSCMSRSFLGKDIVLSIEDNVYVGVLSEEETKLTLKD
jgi:hypothetical protein